jgi:hypothetical protein
MSDHGFERWRSVSAVRSAWLTGTELVQAVPPILLVPSEFRRAEIEWRLGAALRAAFGPELRIIVRHPTKRTTPSRIKLSESVRTQASEAPWWTR